MGHKGLSFTVKGELWTLAFALDLRTWLDFFHDGMDGDGTEGIERQPSSQINHLATTQSPLRGSLECFP